MKDLDLIAESLRQSEYFDSEEGADQYAAALAALDRVRAALEAKDEALRAARLALHDFYANSDPQAIADAYDVLAAASRTEGQA